MGLLDEPGFLPFKGVPSPKAPSIPSLDVEETSDINICCIDFRDDSNMPSIVDLASAGLLQSPCLSGKPPTEKGTWFTCNTIMNCLCVFGIYLASFWSPESSFCTLERKI